LLTKKTIKKKFTFLSLFTLLIASAILVISGCTKEGEQGPAGTPGANGENGINGTNGTAGCIQCHDDTQVMFAKINQWEHSTHATGGNFERNSTDCAPCHTSQGFREVLVSGSQVTTEAIDNPNPINCYSCHKVHETYTPADWNLTTSEPFALWINGEIYDKGTSNMCAHCHQPRIPDPLPVVGGGDVAVTSPYWGLHHGPQSNMLIGTGGYEVGTGYTNSAHTNSVTNGCVECHMATAYGVQAGGHTFGMTYEYHGSDAVSQAGCVSCHDEPAELKTKIENTKAEIDELLTDLKVVLLDIGVLDEGDHVVPGTWTADQAGGVLNYNMVREDRSGGSHNANYAIKLLENTIAALTN